MLNSRPNNKNYHQGNYTPNNKDKVIKLNALGGLFYRSGMELKVMKYLDFNENVIKWGAECLKIPYQMKHFDNGDVVLKEHCYYPDFYYELKIGNITNIVVAEVKPMNEYKMVQDLLEGKLSIPVNGTKKLKNFEYSLKMAYKNKTKFETMINWCDKKGYKFIIITEETLKMI